MTPKSKILTLSGFLGLLLSRSPRSHLNPWSPVELVVYRVKGWSFEGIHFVALSEKPTSKESREEITVRSPANASIPISSLHNSTKSKCRKKPVVVSPTEV